MKKIKTIIDREPVSSDYIASKQDFNNVVKQVEQLKSPVWKSGWFYGPIGMASVAVTISIARIDTTEAKTEVSERIIAQKEDPPSMREESIQVLNIEETSPQKREKPDIPTNEEAIEAPIEEKNTHLPTIVSNREADQQTVEKKSEYPVYEEKPTVKRISTIPHIGRNYTGNIAISELAQPITVNEMVEVVEFSIHFNTLNGTDSRHVQGNQIPEDVIESIKKYNNGYMFFINDIKGKKVDGAIISLLSMNFTATN